MGNRSLAITRIESLLRPPVELYSSGVTFSMAAFLSITPEVLMMTPVVAYGSASALVLMGAVRFSQGFNIIRYKRGLRRLPYYSLKAKDVSVSRKKIFLGKAIAGDKSMYSVYVIFV